MWIHTGMHPTVLYEVTEGDPESWHYPFIEIAQSKAFQLWHGHNDGGTDTLPHLLFRCDTPFWGGVKRSGIVVACSGYEPHYDRMIAGMAADIMIGRLSELDEERCEGFRLVLSPS